MKRRKSLFEGSRVRMDRLHPVVALAIVVFALLGQHAALTAIRHGMQGPAEKVISLDVATGSMTVRADVRGRPLAADVLLLR